MDPLHSPEEAIPEAGEGTIMESHEVSRRRFLSRTAAGAAGVTVAGGLLAACGSSGTTGTAATGASGTPTKGGTLRVGVGGGGPSDVIDPQFIPDWVVQIYAFSLFDQVTHTTPTMQLENRLAEELTPNASATEWTLRLRQGVEFHNGKTLSSDDIIYSFNRIMNPKTHATTAWIGAFLKSMSKLDSRTVRFHLSEPVGWFDLAIGDGGATGMVPEGFDPKHPIGTGPFKFVSYTPGQQAVFERFPNYWGGPAYVDKLIVNTINDDDARLNALITGQVDILQGILASQVAQVQGNSNYKLYNSPSAGFSPITMRVDKAPFDDVRVRQALRLCINRTQVTQNAYSGYAMVGNDLYSPFDPDFDKSLVRHQDLDQARSLLKQAGQSNLTATLTVAPLTPGLVQECEVIAQNASQIGAKINIQQVPTATLFGPNYLTWPLAVDTYPGLRYLTTSALNDGPFASINETHFKDPKYEKLWTQASTTTNQSTRHQLLQEMQQILFNEGGYIIPAFPNAVAAASSKLGGYGSRDLRGFGPLSDNLNKIYFTS